MMVQRMSTRRKERNERDFISLWYRDHSRFYRILDWHNIKVLADTYSIRWLHAWKQRRSCSHWTVRSPLGILFQESESYFFSGRLIMKCSSKSKSLLYRIIPLSYYRIVNTITCLNTNTIYDPSPPRRCLQDEGAGHTQIRRSSYHSPTHPLAQ